MKIKVNRPLNKLMNIGKTIEARLNEVGVYDEESLARLGPVEAYHLIKSRYPNRTIPICYYLYSLQGALDDLHWDDLPTAQKTYLKDQVAS